MNRYSTETKQQVFEKYLSSLSILSLREKNARIHADGKKKQKELSIILDTSLLSSVEETQRITCARNIIERYGVNVVCRILKIRKSNLYYHTLRAPKETVYEMRDRQLRPVILKICESSKARIGAEKIRQHLIEQGLTASKRKVLDILREIRPDYQAGRPKKEKQRSWITLGRNVLARKFSPVAPNMVWVSDFTELKTDRGTYYLCAVLDLFSRRVIAARLSSYCNAELACLTFQDAYQLRNCPSGLIFHSDRGGQYTSNEFRALLEDCGAIQSLSTPGVPYDNAPMESFFARLKTEETSRFRYRSFEDLFLSVQDYLNFYNCLRPHSSAGGTTPVRAEQEYSKKQNAGRINGCVPFA